MHIKSIVAGAAIVLIAGVGSVSADGITVDGIAVNTGTLLALPAGVATPMSEADLDAVRGGGFGGSEPFLAEIMIVGSALRAGWAPAPGKWELFFDGSAIRTD